MSAYVPLHLKTRENTNFIIIKIVGVLNQSANLIKQPIVIG